MNNELEVIMRQIQWERAKGELKAFLATYTRNYSEHAAILKKDVENFIIKAEQTLDNE